MSARPLEGVTVLEVGGIGPVPFCGMVLADLGAEVVVVRRPASGGRVDELTTVTEGILERGRRRRIDADLKQPAGVEAVRDAVGQVDALIEGFRPGTMERLGFAPEACWELNPRLVFGRMTGWGQEGPYADQPGHDINYLALNGVLAAVGPKDRPPQPPLNLVADFGGGGLLLATGVLAALLGAARSGRGSVVDAAMTDGAALQMTMMYELLGRGHWTLSRESNMNDGGAPFYRTYETADGRFVAVGAMERTFWDILVQRLGLDDGTLPDQWDRAAWPDLSARLAAVFRRRSRDEWAAELQHAGACVTPVLTMAEAPAHPHNVARAAFVADAHGPVPAPAPRIRPPSTRDGGPR